MVQQIKVVYYTNQFFGQIGGESEAGIAPFIKHEAVGPGKEIEKLMHPKAKVISTIIGGDNYMAQDLDKSAMEIVELLKDVDFDILLAGPAFSSGRYGMACGAVCKAVNQILHKLTVTAMHPENPGVDPYKAATYIVPCDKTAANMRDALRKLTSVGLKLADGQKPSLAEGEYIMQGRRVNVFKEKPGAVRAFDMLNLKLKGKPYETELPMPKFDKVKPASALKDLSKARIVFISTGGMVPLGNPDKLPSFNANKWAISSIEGITNFKRGDWEQVHGGYDGSFANDDPDRIVPLDAAIELERSGMFGKLHREYIYTVGNITSLDSSVRFGKEIAQYMKKNNIDAAVMTST